jgi:hypothetical protein
MIEPVFTLRELAERIDAPIRAVKFWTEQRAIRALTEHHGKGFPRLFDLSEARIASLIAPFAEQGLTIGSLVWLGGVFRRCFAARSPDNPDSLQFKSGDLSLLQVLDRAVAEEGENWLVVVDTPELRSSSGQLLLSLLSDKDSKPQSGVWLRLDTLIPGNVDRRKAVVSVIDLTARLALLR